MSKLHTTLLTVLVLFALAIGASAAPQLIDYQGYLEDDNGNPITDTLSMTFTIYTASTGGTSKWTETQSSVEILGGLFNVTLGSSTAIPDTVFNQDDRWLQISVGGNDVSPRTRIVSTAYAHRVNTVDGASGGTINGDIKAGKGNFGTDNTNNGAYTFVAGQDNVAGAAWSTIGGGLNNETVSEWCTIGGGKQNSAVGWVSTVGGGEQNTAGHRATVGGGYQNTANAQYATVSGGIWGYAGGWHSVVAGGMYDTASSTGAVVSGGEQNTASGEYSVIPGGAFNEASGNYSFAAGNRAQALHLGSFVWADNSSPSTFASVRNYQFRARVNGGARFDVNNSRWVEMYDDGTNLINTSTGARLTLGGVWTNASDKNAKENFTPLDTREILQKVARLPITRWNYRSESDKITHVGPMAQDFYAIFGLGADNKTISTIDPAGVALAAIQEVYRITQELEKKTSRIDNLEAQLAELQAQVTTLLAERQAKSADGKTLSAVVDK